ncbi:MAG: LrgB family protein, partial [Serratia liquefaciens]|jgi:putative effector of murein hydrolase|nr:LrgB family protein [Serratia liquefaciens]
MGQEEGVVSSLVMMLAGIITVIAAPLIGQLMW